MTNKATLEQTVRFRLDRQGYIKQFNPRFQKPIQHGKDAIPVGNGDFAAVAWQPEHLTWTLSFLWNSSAFLQLFLVFLLTKIRNILRFGHK